MIELPKHPSRPSFCDAFHSRTARTPAKTHRRSRSTLLTEHPRAMSRVWNPCRPCRYVVDVEEERKSAGRENYSLARSSTCYFFLRSDGAGNFPKIDLLPNRYNDDTTATPIMKTSTFALISTSLLLSSVSFAFPSVRLPSQALTNSHTGDLLLPRFQRKIPLLDQLRALLSRSIVLRILLCRVLRVKPQFLVRESNISSRGIY